MSGKQRKQRKQRKRSRRTAKDNGTRMESAVESYLQWALDDLRIQRLRLRGSKDIGDIGNVFFHGRPVCIEVKWTQTMNAPQHMREAIREAGNMDSPYPWVVQKKRTSALPRSTSWANSTPTRHRKHWMRCSPYRHRTYRRSSSPNHSEGRKTCD